MIGREGSNQGSCHYPLSKPLMAPSLGDRITTSSPSLRSSSLGTFFGPRKSAEDSSDSADRSLFTPLNFSVNACDEHGVLHKLKVGPKKGFSFLLFWLFPFAS